MINLETTIDQLQQQVTQAMQDHAAACLAAIEGGEQEQKLRDKARANLAKLENELAETRAALTAATEHKRVEDKKAEAQAVVARQRRVASIHSDIHNTATELDRLFIRLAELVMKLSEQTNALRLEGVRDAQRPLSHMDRVIGSFFHKSGIHVGKQHPFDTKPIKLVDFCPDLSTVLPNKLKEGR